MNNHRRSLLLLNLLTSSILSSLCVLCVLCGSYLSASAEAPEEISQRLQTLLPKLASPSPGEREQADREIEKICFAATRPGAEAERRAAALALAGALDQEGLAAAAKVLAARRLGQIGRFEAVSALSRLLDARVEAELRDAARRALEANPTFPALRALREAMEASEGEFKAALIRSLGNRRDLLSVGPIASYARSDDKAIRRAAFCALAEIGDRQGQDSFEEALGEARGEELEELLEIYVRLAWRLLENGEGGAARRIFLQLLLREGRWRCAGLEGLGKAGIPGEVPKVVAALEDPDAKVRQAALEALASLRGATPALVQRLEAAGEKEAVPLLEILGKRRDAAALPAILKKAAEAGDPVRLAAVEALAEIGGSDAVAPLAARLEDGSAVVRGAAERALSELAAKDLGDTLAERWRSAGSPEARAALVRIFGRRRNAAGYPVILQAAGDSDAAVRQAAYQALGRTGIEGGFPLLLAAMKKERGAAREGAVQALGRFRDEAATEAILNELGGSPPEVKAALAQMLGGRKHPKVLPALKQLAGDLDEKVRGAALSALGALDDPSVLPLLLQAAESGPAELKPAALQACLRQAEALSEAGKAAAADKAAALRVYLQVLELAGRDEEKRPALVGIGEIGGPEALERVKPFIKPGPLQREAGRAAARLAERLPEGRREEAVAIYRQVLSLDVDDATATQCVRRLRRLGVSVDLARQAGAVSRWWILGPFPSNDLEKWAAAVKVESVDTAKETFVEKDSLCWKAYETDHIRGIVDLLEAVAQADGLGAFLYAEVDVKSAGEALLKMGSDDQIHCWLNGKKVHAFTGNRGVGLDQDSVPVQLQAGANRLLLAVLNSGGGWASVLRIADQQGKPLEFEIKSPPGK